MRRWTILAKGFYPDNSGGDLTIVNPEDYVSFPDETTANLFSIALNNDDSLAIQFVESHWGDGYAECNRFEFKAVERDWWADEHRPDDPDKSSIAKLEDKWANKIRSQFITDANRILKTAVAEIKALNVSDFYSLNGAVANFAQNVYGDHMDSQFKKMLRKIDESGYYNEAAAHKLNEKLELLSMDD